MTVAIIGLGLIGGSFAKALKARSGHRVLGWDRDRGVLDAALDACAIDGVCESVSEADLTLVALYPTAAVAFVTEHAERFKPGSVVVDLCGVKRYVCGSLRPLFTGDVAYIGGHPMAGRECSGFENSLATLFDGASMILTPDDQITPERLTPVCDFFRELGFGHIEVTSDTRHDEMIAYTSQLAHIVSSAYVKSPVARDYNGFSAGSFADMTRVAKLNEVMWTELFLHNSDFLQEQIQVIIDNLGAFRDTLAARDADALQKLLREGREIKEALE